MSDLLHFAEFTLQEIALLIMACVYTLRIIWILHFKAGRERQAPTGQFRTTKAKGIVYSWMNIAMPWSMESTRTNFFFYIQFVIFHIGVVAAIAATFIIPYWPELFEINFIVRIFQLIVGAAFVVGLIRLIRRIVKPAVRLISTPDDYFSVALLTAWFASGVFAIPNEYQVSEWPLIVFFVMTTIFLVFVPFSKISHYLYYPFTRYFLGKTMGHRNIFPRRRGGGIPAWLEKEAKN